jgi:hypothetical protein
MLRFLKNWYKQLQSNRRIEAEYKKRVEDLKKKDPFIYK